MTDIWDTAFGLRLKKPQCFGEHVCHQAQSTAEEPILVDPLDKATWQGKDRQCPKYQSRLHGNVVYSD
jgi:hypothetical protein